MPKYRISIKDPTCADTYGVLWEGTAENSFAAMGKAYWEALQEHSFKTPVMSEDDLLVVESKVSINDIEKWIESAQIRGATLGESIENNLR